MPKGKKKIATANYGISPAAKELAQKFHRIVNDSPYAILTDEQIKTAFVLACQYEDMGTLNRELEKL